MTNGFFITGTGTGVGKTLVTAALAHQHMHAGHRVAALKPVVSGFSYEDAGSDPVLLLHGLGQRVTREAVDAISPWRYAAHLSPQLAAEGHAPRAEQVAEFCRATAASADVALVEGAGGVMTPLNDKETMLNVSAVLGWPVILVAGTYLGSISHTLTALHALKSAKVHVHSLILSESAQDPVLLADVAASIRGFTDPGLKIYIIPRLLAQDGLWRNIPALMP